MKLIQAYSTRFSDLNKRHIYKPYKDNIAVKSVENWKKLIYPEGLPAKLRGKQTLYGVVDKNEQLSLLHRKCELSTIHT